MAYNIKFEDSYEFKPQGKTHTRLYLALYHSSEEQTALPTKGIRQHRVKQISRDDIAHTQLYRFPEEKLNR